MPDKAVKPDSELVVLLRKGGMEAFDLLFERYAGRLYRFSFSLLKTREDSEEVVQETFFRIWEKRAGISDDKSFQSYLFTIAYHVIVDQARKRLKERKFEEFLVREATKNYTESHLEIEYNDLKSKIEQVIDKLPGQRRIIYNLSRNVGLSHKEIADKLNISPKTVENQINLALKQLKKFLRENNLTVLLFIHLFL